MSSSTVRVSDVLAALERRFPLSWAEEWDNVGLIVGELDAVVGGVLVTLDATGGAVERAAAASANLLVTHHPPHLEPLARPERSSGPAGTLEAALRLGVSVISLHTNLDRSPEGAEALARVLDFEVLEPLESAAEKVALVVTYVPQDAVERVREAMAAAGAGRIGEYEKCAFVGEGTGLFEPLGGATPVVADEGQGVEESRLEMVVAPAAVAQVLAAARDAHPYEEPVVIATEALRARGVARMGRLCAWRSGATLEELASHVARNLGGGCRVWGKPGRTVERIAIGNGSAGSLIPDALRMSADVLVAGEVRYHDALAAASAGLAIVEAGHDRSEWPLVSVLAEALRQDVEGVGIIAEPVRTDWWMTEEPHDRG